MVFPPVAHVLADHFLRYDGLRFQEFADANRATEWVIASDYVNRGKEHPTDAFCYTVYPMVGSYSDLAAEINDALPGDLKKTRMVSPRGTAFIKDHRWFSYCFVLNKERKPFNSTAGLGQ